MTKKPHRVYLSYAKADAHTIPRVLKQLESMGLVSSSDEITTDSDLQPGHASLRDGVRRQIQSASKVVILWSPSSVSSQWVNYELGLADAFGKAIIPVVRQRDLGTLPIQLQEVQAVVLTDGDA